MGRRALRRGPGLIISGPAGIGKSRLARELASSESERNIVTRHVLATSGASAIPFAALAPVIPFSSGAVDQDWPMVVRQAREGLASLSQSTRPLLVIDDADLLDRPSAVLLLQLVESESIALVLTVRTGRPPPDEIERLSRDKGLYRLELGPLDDEGTALLVADLLEGPVDDLLLSALSSVCEGSPLFIEELVSTARASGDLEVTEGIWRLVGERFTASGAVTDYVSARLDGLRSEVRTALEYLAIAEGLGLDDLVGLSSEDAVEHLESEALIGVEIEHRRRTVRLAHPLYGEVIASEMPHVRRERIISRLSELIESHGARRRDDAVRLSLWALRIGKRPDIDRLMEAGHFARMALDYELAARLAEAAVDVGGGFAPAALLGEMAYELGEFDRARDALAQAGALASEPREHALAGLSQMGNAVLGLGQPDFMETVIEKLRAIGLPDEWQMELELRRALMLVNLGRPVEALETADRYLPQVRSLTRCWVEERLVRAHAMSVTTRAEDALVLGQSAFADQLTMPPDVMLPNGGMHLVHTVVAMGECGQLDEALGLAEMCYAETVRRRLPAGQLFFLAAMARDLLRCGDLTGSFDRFRSAAATARHYNHWSFLSFALSGCAGVRALMGETAESDALLLRAEAVGRTLPLLEADGERMRALNLWAKGSVDEALETLSAAAGVAGKRGFHYAEAAALHDIVRIGYPESVVERLTELAATTQGPMGELRMAHAVAAIARDPDGLEQVAAGWKERGFALIAAETYAQAADDHRFRGSSVRKNRVMARVLDLTQSHPTWASPGLVRVLDEAPPLSRREREVALLAVDGLSNRQIGEHLNIAKRTVDNHLQNIFGKLGTNGRGGLGDALGL